MQSVERWTLLLLLVGLKAQGEWRLFKVELYSADYRRMRIFGCMVFKAPGHWSLSARQCLDS